MAAAIEIITGLVLLFWVGLWLDRRRSWPTQHRLEVRPTGETGRCLDRVVAIVPARNEADVIDRTLASLFEQERADGRPSDLEVILVDDRSTDGTAEVAREAAERLGVTGRLTVVENTPTPDGWAGKVHAMASGVRAAISSSVDAKPDVFLFSDADIAHRKTSLLALRQKAAEGGFDMVSVMARLHASSFWERLLIPPFVYFFQLLYPFRLVSRRESRVAAAAGGCVLIRREALERAGGIEAIRSALIDDVSLACAVKEAGGHIWLGFDPEIVSVRPYQDLREIWDMVARSAFIQLGYRYSLLALVVLGILLFFVAPPLIIALGIAFEVSDAAPPRWMLSWLAVAGLGVMTCFLQAISLLPSVRHHRVPSLFALTLPLAALLYGAMTASSAWRYFWGGGTRWKGREFREDK